MTRVEYELLSDQMPELKLPAHFTLRKEHVEFLETLSRDELIAARARVLLVADYIDNLGFPHYSKP